MSKSVNLTSLILDLNGEPLVFGTQRKTVETEQGPGFVVEKVTLSFKELAIRKMKMVRVSKKDAALGTKIYNLLVKLQNHTSVEEFSDDEIDILMNHAFYGSDVITVNRAKELLLSDD